MWVRGLGGIALAMSAAGAQAAEVPLYKPAPAWVKPAPPIDAAGLTDNAPILVLFDTQHRLEKGEVWSYQDMATRLASPEVVAQAGTVSIPWNPAKGDLVVHRVAILRGGTVIDALAGDKRFTVLRREQQLEQRSMDGTLTATLPVEGLQVGDVLRVTVSTSTREPAFGEAMQTAAPLPVEPVRAGFVRARILWPRDADVRWRAYADGAKPVVAEADGWREMTLTGALPKPAELPDDAPLRYRKLTIVEATSFGGWEAVSRAMAPLYGTDGLIAPGSPLAAEVARIAAAHSDPRARAAAALELVQDKVRYLANGLGNGNYQPQVPADTWSLRYGDCKAKTLLLLGLLRALDITAEPVLASSQLGDLLPDRLPSAGAFDHVLVRAEVGADTLWLDGTAGGGRLADLGDVPGLRHVLPVRAGGAALMPVPLRAPARPQVAVSLDIDQSAGLAVPALVKGEIRLRGQPAEMVGLAKTQGSKDQQAQLVTGLMMQAAGTSVTLAIYGLAYDRDAGEATVTATGVGQTRWRKENGRYRLVLDHGVSELEFAPDRSRTAWTAIPVATGQPETIGYRTRIRLPDGGKGFTLEGDRGEATPLPGMTVRRTVTQAGAELVLDERIERTGAEIAAADVAAVRARVGQAKQRLLTGIAPADVPARWQIAAAGRSDGRFKPLIAGYTAAIAADPEERDGYLNRARFLIGIHDPRAALPDLDQALKLQNDPDTRSLRAGVLRQLRQDDKAAEDWRAALALDGDRSDVLVALGAFEIDHGGRDAALARVQERIDAGGRRRADMLAVKADLLARAGDRDGAIAAMDEAVKDRPGDPNLLNSRCWIKAELKVALDTALKDCTKAIELGENPAAALDSRALAYWRLDRADDALADLEAALEIEPGQASSLYLRGLIRARRGEAAAAKADIDAARLIDARIEDENRRFGIGPASGIAAS